MALIKCAECGKEISDNASSCPNCGCPIEQEEKKIFCVECGNQLNANDKICKNCGCPNEVDYSIKEKQKEINYNKNKGIMGLFKKREKKETRVEYEQRIYREYTAPIIEMGFVPSKIIQTYPDLFISLGFLMVDTENKKWAYVNKEIYEKKKFKIYDFKDLIKYEVQIDNGQTATTLYGFGMGELHKEIKRIEMILYTGSKDIDDFCISIMKNLIPLYQNSRGYPRVMAKIDEIKIILEYILNNK